MELIQEILTIKSLLAIVNVILIDIVMSWDNAILIWMAVKNLKEEQRKKAITFWIILATILRIWLSLIAVFLLSITWLVLAWWLLLLYVVWKFYKELRSEQKWEHHLDTKWNTNTLMWALYTIVIADISMSLDNVLAVAWASHWNIWILAFWLIFSIILMAIASSLIAKYLDKYPQIQWLGLFVILFVAIEMIIKWTSEIWWKVHYNIFPFLSFILWWIFIVLNKKYIKPIQEEIIKDWFSKNHLKIIIFNILSLITLIFFWDKITNYLNNHKMFLYFIVFILFFAILEIMEIYLRKEKKNV